METQPGNYRIVYEPHVTDLPNGGQIIQAIYVTFEIDHSTEYLYSLYLKQQQFEIEYATFNHVTDQQIMVLDQIGDLFEQRSWQIGKSLQITARGSAPNVSKRKSS